MVVDGEVVVVVEACPADVVEVLELAECWVVLVANSPTVVEVVEPSTGSGSTRIKGIVVVDVDDESVSVPAAAATTVAGISVVGWITLLRTCATAPHAKARATRAATTQPTTSFDQFGMNEVSRLSGSWTLCERLRDPEVASTPPDSSPCLHTMSPMASVLIIEDDFAIRQGLAQFLAEEGMSVESYASGMEGVQRAAEGEHDVIVLDLGLPDVDGGQVLKMIRAVSQVPIIVATARDEEKEIVRILKDGADDYVVKPYSGAQLHARIEAILRRVSSGSPGGSIVIGDLTVDPEQRVATLGGNELELTRKEFDFLAYLAAREGVVVSKRELLAEVWRQPYGGADKTIDVHLSVLRRKLGESAADARYLQTVHGVGIKLVAPES